MTHAGESGTQRDAGPHARSGAHGGGVTDGKQGAQASMAELDHLLLGAPDLDAASEAFAALTGVTPKTGGSHPGHGTRNHLVGLAGGIYLEIIAPDPAQDLDGTLGAQLAALSAPRLWSAAFRTPDLPARLSQAEAAGATRDCDIFTMSRAREDGTLLEWSILRVASFIDTVGDFAVAVVVGGGVPTMNFRVDYLRPSGGPHLKGRAVARRIGRTVGVVDIDVTDAEGRLTAIGRATYSAKAG
jgi:hypothetical protein